MQKSRKTSEARNGMCHNASPTHPTKKPETRGHKAGALLAGLIRREASRTSQKTGSSDEQAKTDGQTLARIADVAPDYERIPKEKRSPVRRIVVKRSRD